MVTQLTGDAKNQAETNVIVMVVQLIPSPIRRAAVQRMIEVAAATDPRLSSL